MKDYGNVIHRTIDDSYVIDKGGFPFHVYPFMKEFAEEWDNVFEYAETHPECVTEEEPIEISFEQHKLNKKIKIDNDVSAAIFAGFDYSVNDVLYHFNYNMKDQQNFSDTANLCILKQLGISDLPDNITWNAYTIPDSTLVQLTFNTSEFLALYTNGALAHKNTNIQKGNIRKELIAKATTIEELEAI